MLNRNAILKYLRMLKSLRCCRSFKTIAVFSNSNISIALMMFLFTLEVIGATIQPLGGY